MRRGVLWVGIALFGIIAAPWNVALAAPEVGVAHAPDGTLLVVGSGWRPNQQLVVNVGVDRFPAYVDSAGEFEVSTGLATKPADVSVHRPQHSEMSFAALEAPAQANPLAILFAQSLASGVAVLLLCAVALGGGYTILRTARRPRS